VNSHAGVDTGYQIALTGHGPADFGADCLEDGDGDERPRHGGSAVGSGAEVVALHDWRRPAHQDARGRVAGDDVALRRGGPADQEGRVGLDAETVADGLGARDIGADEVADDDRVARRFIDPDAARLVAGDQVALTGAGAARGGTVLSADAVSVAPVAN